METLIRVNSRKKEVAEIVSPSLQSIILPLEVYAELEKYVEHYTTEVSGCGLVKREETRVVVGEYRKSVVHTVTYRVTEVFLPPRQDNTAGGTEFDEVMVSEIITKLLEEGKDPSQLRLHWHSHATMGTFHSAVDEDNYSLLDNKEFLVSLVLNRKKEVLGRVDVYSPVIVSFIDVPVFVGLPTTAPVTEKVSVNIKALDEFIAKAKEERFGNKWYDREENDDNKNKQLTYNGVVNYDEIKRQYKLKKKLRHQLNISNDQALKYEFCTQQTHTCNFCQEAELCAEYTQKLYERLYNK